MVRGRYSMLRRLALFMIPLVGSFIMFALSPQPVSAAPAGQNRGEYNQAETNARNRCISEGWQALRYGAIWINTGSYYDYTVNVGAYDNTATVYIAGSVYGCHNGNTNNTYAVQIAPWGPNYWRLTGLSSTSLFRGQSLGAHNWSSQGAQISAQLDVSDLARNNATGPDNQTITIDLYRCFSTNPTSPTGACYPETVPITINRAAQPGGGGGGGGGGPTTNIGGLRMPSGQGVPPATIQYVTGVGEAGTYSSTFQTADDNTSYGFNVNWGWHRIRAPATLPGWVLVSYTYCRNNIIPNCGGAEQTVGLGGGTDAVFDLSDGSSIDLWWNYERDEGYILGRVWNDLNGDGDPTGEPILQNGTNCGGAYQNVNVSISVSGYPNANPGDSGNCNPEPFYIQTVAPGNYNVSVNPPAGWSATTGTQNVNVGRGEYVHRWFGIWIPDQCPNKPGIQWPGLDPGDIKYGNNCFAITCDTAGFSFTPPNPSPGQPFSMRAGFIVNTYSGSVNYDDPSKDIRITNSSGLVITSPNPQNYSPASIPNGGAGYADFNVAGAPTGTYTIVWELSGTPATGCSNTVVVSNKPYFRAYGGDIIAGAGFKDSSGTCSINGGKRQVAFNGLAGANYTGAGNSHGSFATGTIVDFVSGTLKPGGPNDPDMFAFTNQSGTYGGNFWTSNLGSACAPDYYGLKPASGLNNIATPFYSASSFGTGNYDATSGPPGGPRLIITGGTISAGTDATVYADGDVFIDGNIDYAGSTSGYGNNPLNVPSLRVIARGNIYVGPNVTQLHGIFVAQPNGGAKGIFYTCGLRSGVLFRAPTQTLSGSTITSSELAGTGPGQCGQNRLAIYGSVNALAIKLLRTAGTVPGAVEGYPSGAAAEQFIFTPDTWFNGQTSNTKAFQSYTALPPIL